MQLPAPPLLIRGASPLELPYTRSRSPLRRLAPIAWLARGARSRSLWRFPLRLPYTRSRSPLRRLAPCAWARSAALARALSGASPKKRSPRSRRLHDFLYGFSRRSAAGWPHQEPRDSNACSAALCRVLVTRKLLNRPRRCTILTLTGERATGIAYCPGASVTVDGYAPRLMVRPLNVPRSLTKICSSWNPPDRKIETPSLQ